MREPSPIRLEPAGLTARVEALEDAHARLERRFEKIRGELNQAYREQRELERENDDLRAKLEDDDEEPDYDGE